MEELSYIEALDLLWDNFISEPHILLEMSYDEIQEKLDKEFNYKYTLVG